MRLDERDLEILRILAGDGRITKADLARRINLTPTPAWERLKRLEQAGLIAGYRAEISLKALGPHVTVFVAVELLGHTVEDFTRFEGGLHDYPEVTACWALGGGFDYLMQVVTRDIDSYQRLIDRMLENRIGLSRYYTYIVTKPVKGPDLPPLGLLAGLQKD
ncbi:MAG: Lrp/AsnC family transcriptional regulator [Rhodovulum sp.]